MSRLTSYVSRHSAPATYATILVAFFLRVYRLADKNIWWDEGWSLWLAKQTFGAIALRTAADEHPPLHYWMLKVWGAIFGSSAYAGRFLSVAFGVMTIALIYWIGKRVGGSWVGVLAAFILAISRFHIWWSQDIKNYTPSILFAFAAVGLALRLIAASEWQRAERQSLRAGDWRLAVGYALFAALAVFTHYLATLVLLALNLYALGHFAFHALRLRRLPLLLISKWLIANLLAVILFAPWLYLYWQNAQPWVAAPAFDFGIFLKLVATVLPLGVTTDIDNYFWPTLVFGILALLGGAWIFVSRDEPGRNILRPYGLIALSVLFPPLLIYILALTPAAIFAPKIQARYLVVLAPAYALLLALGIAFLARWTRYAAFAAMLFVLASNAFVLNDYYAERRLTDEYATLANTINAFARPGDLVLLDTDQEWPTFLHYLRPRLDWLGIANGAAMTDSTSDTIIKRALGRHDAVWLVTIPDALATDPQKMVETRLAREWKKQFEKTFDDKRLALYSPEPRDLVKLAPENFSPQIQNNFVSGSFLGFDLPVREARVGDTVRIVTYWALPRETQIVVALGQVSATHRVGMGERVRVESDLLLPPHAVGELPLTVNQVKYARVRVEPRATTGNVAAITHRVNYRLGDSIHLVGYDLPITNYRAGGSASLTLYWLADAPIAQNYVAFVHLLGSDFNAAQNGFLWGQLDRVPNVPLTAWQPNQTVADPYRVPIAANAPAGKYQIEIGMYDAVTGARLRLQDGSDAVIIAQIEIAR